MSLDMTLAKNIKIHRSGDAKHSITNSCKTEVLDDWHVICGYMWANWGYPYIAQDIPAIKKKLKISHSETTNRCSHSGPPTLRISGRVLSKCRFQSSISTIQVCKLRVCSRDAREAAVKGLLVNSDPKRQEIASCKQLQKLSGRLCKWQIVFIDIHWINCLAINILPCATRPVRPQQAVQGKAIALPRLAWRLRRDPNVCRKVSTKHPAVRQVGGVN